MHRKRSFFVAFSLFLILLIGSTSGVLADEASYIDSSGNVHTVTDAQPFPDVSSEVTLGQEGQETWYILEGKEYYYEAFFTVAGNVNIINPEPFPDSPGENSALLYGQFRVPGDSTLSFYGSVPTDESSGCLEFYARTNAVTGLGDEMGEVNLESGWRRFSGAIEGDNPLIGPSIGQSGGVINIRGGFNSINTYDDSPPEKVCVGTADPANTTCQVNFTENGYFNSDLAPNTYVAASTEPGPDNNYGVCLKDNGYITSYGIGTAGNYFVTNPDGTPANGLIESIITSEYMLYHSNTIVLGDTSLPIRGQFTYDFESVFTIPEGNSLTIPQDVLLIMSDSSRMIIDGELINNSSFMLNGEATISGSGTVKNNNESFIQPLSPWTDFTGSFENAGKLYITNEDYGQFQYPSNYVGDPGEYLEFIDKSQPSNGVESYPYDPIGNPEDVQIETTMLTFGTPAQGALEPKMIVNGMFAYQQVSGVYLQNEFIDVNNYLIRVSEESGGSKKLTRLMRIRMEDVEPLQTVYMAPNGMATVNMDGCDAFLPEDGTVKGVSIEQDTGWLASSSDIQSQVIEISNSQTGQAGFIQVHPIPLGLPLSSNGTPAIDNFLMEVSPNSTNTVSVEASPEAGWSLTGAEFTGFLTGSEREVTFFPGEVFNGSALGGYGSKMGTISPISDTSAEVSLGQGPGAGLLAVKLSLQAPTGETYENSYMIGVFSVDATSVSAISLGPGEQSAIPTLEFSPENYPNGIWYDELFNAYDRPDLFYALTPFCLDGEFETYEFAMIGVSPEIVLENGQYTFVSSDPDIISYNQSTKCFEFGSKEGIAQIFIQNADGSLSTLNAPAGQVRYLSVQVGDTVLPETVTLDQERVYLTTLPGGTASATVGYSLSPENAAGNPEWSIEPTTVAEVTPNPDGSAIVNAVAEGVATLTCRIGDAEGSAAVTVSDRGVTCDSVELTANGSPDTFNVIAKNLQPNPALGGGKPVVRGEMFAYSASEPSDLNAKRLVNVPGTNDWMVGSIPVNGSRVNNWFYYADYINVHVYASTDILSDGELVWAGWHSWTDGSPLGGTVQYTGIVFDEGFGIPTVSSGIAGAMGKPIIGLRVSSLVPGVDVETSFYTQDTGWFGSESDGSMWYEDGASVVPYTTLGGYMGLGNSTVIQAYRFRLTGEEAGNYDLQFRAYVQDAGWQDWVSVAQNPEAVMGFPGEDLSIEAFCMRLVPAGTPLPDATVFK